jgi:hypothetical protein
MMTRTHVFVAAAVAANLFGTSGRTPLHAQVPTPASVIGFEPGEDFKLADYAQLTAYYQALAAASDRVRIREIGRTTRGLPMFVLYISSPENLARLDEWRSISARLALAQGLGEAEARRLAREGRAVVWIDAGLHSTEVAHSQMAPHLAHHLATDETDETRRFRDDVVVLLMPGMNPDGHEIVVDWYRRNLGTPFETTSPPDVYHEYVGHDINRDWFMITQAETRAVSRVLYEEWFPQIIFNHHQTAPFPARIFIPPFADPVNPHIPPLVVRGVNIVGEHMAKRLEEENMPGVVSRMSFTMWWNGGMRTVPYFKNMVGLLSEVGHASATPQYHEPDSLPEYFGTGSHRISTRDPSVYYANPWRGGWARLGDAVQYHLVSSLGAIDIASRLREDWLFNIYRMGRDAIAAGEAGGPYAYVVPIDESQWDTGEAVNLLNTLQRGGVEVRRATAPFTADGRGFPANSYIVPAAQAFRAYVLDLMEPQEHPHHEQYPGGPPQAPYGGLSGWTLPIQMGVQAHRIERPFTAQAVVVDAATLPAPHVVADTGFGYLIAPRRNDVHSLVLELLRAGDRVSVTSEPLAAAGTRWNAGTLIIERGAGTAERLQLMTGALGLPVAPLDARPAVAARSVRLPRVAMYRSWTANMDEGWTRYILDQHGYEPITLRDADIRAGDLAGYDIIILPDQGARSILEGHAAGRMPDELTGGVGEAGAAALRRYVDGGGRVLAFDAATDFAIEQFGLPLRNPLAGLPQTELYVPGSLIRMNVDPSHPVAFGMQAAGAAFVQGARAFEPTGAVGGNTGAVEVIARYGERDLLLSGWEIGAEAHMAGRPAVVRVPLGQGDVVLVGFRPQFRAWPTGTFKLIFNSILGAAAERPGAE